MREGLPQLLNDPVTRWMPGDIKVQDMPPIVADDEEAVQQAECCRGNREEIHCRNGFTVIPQKSEPTPARFWLPRRSSHPAGDRSLGNIETEHEKLAMDARRTPGRVLRDHAKDQIPHFLGDSLPADYLPASGQGTPIQGEASAVPTNHGLGTHRDENLFPSGPESSDRDPEEFVEGSRSWLRVSSLQDCALLAKSQVFEKQCTPRAKQAKNRAE